MMSMIIALLRIVFVFLWIPFGIFLGIIFLAWVNPFYPHVLVIEQWWLRQLIRILGFKTQVEGQAIQQDHIAMINHITWMDPLILSSQKVRSYLVKAEVQSWPVIGTLVKMVGCLFIQRGKGQVYERLEQISQIIHNGHSVGVFPEATTSDGSHVIPFASPLFRIVTEKQCPLQLVGIYYPNPNGSGVHPAIPFIGEQSFVENLVNIAKAPNKTVIIRYFDFTPEPDETAETLAHRAHTVINDWVANFNEPQ